MISISSILSKQLNAEQRAAAIDPTAQVLTLACAGSGKSRTLAYRIAWLLAERGAQADEIVAFTFTEKAADSIKQRVGDALLQCGLDTNLLGRMYIGTIHSFCQELLGRIDARYRQFDVLDENRLKLFLVDKYGAIGLHQIRGSKGYFAIIKEVANAWVTMNEEMLGPSDIDDYNDQLGGVLERLGGALNQAQFIDFSLMQRLAVDAFREGHAQAKIIASSIKHLLVDEYQDINPVQEALIQALSADAKSLFVVGDDDQSIYAWRGADVTRIQTFEDRYPHSAKHTLAVNYRSTPLIVRTADRFAHEELGALRIPKNPKAHAAASPSEMRVLWFGTREQEAQWVVDKIRELIGTQFVEHNGKTRGLTPSDFAILMRSTRQNEPNGHPPRHVAYTARLQDAGLPFTLEAGGSLFERPHVAMLRDLFELLRDGQPDRPTLQTFHNERIVPLFPTASFNQLSKVVAEWARLIHTPVMHGAPRRRIYPQQLLFDILEACELAKTVLDDGVMQEIGVFSQIMQDVEGVFPSVDSTDRFKSILNFLSVVAEDGYDTSATSVVSRPNAITVSTVHRMKGLEFPVVFVVDVENTRFPGKKRGYEGILPTNVIQDSLARGAYQSTREEQARLFYTAVTRAERFLYVTGCALGPGWKRAMSRSPFAVHLRDPEIVTDSSAPTGGLAACPQQRRIEASDLPTSYSDVRYYLKCPKDYQFRKLFGFSPAIPELFGFGKTVHTSVGKLHERFPDSAPTPGEARAVAEDTFHLKHIRPSRDPVGSPGPYERAKDKAAKMVAAYAADHAGDFQRRRQIEARFEIPLSQAVISGAIDLLLKEDEAGKIVEASVIDFKAIEGGDDPTNNVNLEWTELSLQVQLYAKAAREVLGQDVRAGGVHLLKDNQRVSAPVDDDATAAAVSNVEWAVNGIISERYPMRPHKDKCAECDFRQLCPMKPEKFDVAPPPPIHVPGGTRMAAAFALFDEGFSSSQLGLS